MVLKAFSILDKGGFSKTNGEWHPLNSAIDHEEANFIHEIISKYQPKKTLEIGCAEGLSAMVICESIGPDVTHNILDPNQSGYWENMGVTNLRNSGLTNFRIVEEFSELALPDMVRKKEVFDFVFVDGWHTFDHVLVEFFYINRLLPVGGIVMFDDALLTGLNKVMRYISNYPNYKCLGSAGQSENTFKRKALNVLKKTVNAGFSPFGSRVKSELLNDTVIRSNDSLNIDGSVVAFQKTAEDTRDWAWYKIF